MRNKMLILTLSIIFLGCARLEIRKSTGAPGEEGLPYYRPLPYLLVSLDNNGFCKTEVIVLPDLSQDYKIIPHPGIGSIEFAPQLDKGWNLTSFNSKIDTKTAENITAVASLLTAVSNIIPKVPGKEIVPEKRVFGPGLYRFKFKFEEGHEWVSGLTLVGSFTDKDGNALACPSAQTSPAPKPTPAP